MADQLRQYMSLYSSTANSFGTGSSVTITPASVVGLPTSTEITLTFDRVTTGGVKTPTKVERIIGTISGGNFVVRTSPSSGRGVDGTTEQSHTSPVVEMVFNAKDWNDMITWGLVEHNQDGTHKAALVTTLKATGAVVTTGTSDVTIVTPKALADAGHVLDTDGTLAANSDTRIPSQKAVKTYIGTQDGWTASADTWTYASASTFTISGVDRTGIYTKGTRLKFTQTTAKYAVVVSSAFSTNTTVTIAINSDYTIANAAITSPYYSYAACPANYPTSFTFATTWGGFSSNPTGGSGMRYSILGNLLTFSIFCSSDGTSNATSTTFTIPVAAKYQHYVGGIAFTKDNGSNITPTYGHIETAAGNATVSAYKTLYQGAWTNSGAKNFWLMNTTIEI